MGWDNLGGLGFGQALSHVHSAYKKEGRMLAGAQAWFATVGQLFGKKYNSVEKILEQVCQRHEHFMGDKSLKDFRKTPLIQTEFLGSGGFGQVCAGKAGNRDVVIKTGLDPRYQADMEIEFNRSEELRKAVDERVHDSETDFARLQGFGGVVTVLGKGPDGSIIQERIQGDNLFHALRASESNPIYDASGYPKDLQGAKQRSLEFASEMMSIHAAGMVHCDMKSSNLMLDQEGHLRVIDLGGARNIGDNIGAFSSNGGPEYVSRVRKLESTEEEMKTLREEFNTSGISPEHKTAIKEKWGILKVTHDNLVQELQSFEVKPSYDIYSEGTILPAILFGKAGLGMSLQFYEGSEEYLQTTQGMDHKGRTEYFEAAFTELNNDMRAVTGQRYSEEEVQKMSALMAWMMDPEPTHRPTSEQVFTHLMELNNISTAEEENIKAGQKYRSEHPQSLGVDATKRASAQAILEAKRQEVEQAAARFNES